MKIIELIVMALATWRLASLFANEYGPGGIFRKIRSWTREHISGLDSGLECEWCNSVWFGTLIWVAYLLAGKTVVYILMPLAFSTAAIAIKITLQSIGKVEVTNQ